MPMAFSWENKDKKDASDVGDDLEQEPEQHHGWDLDEPTNRAHHTHRGEGDELVFP